MNWAAPALIAAFSCLWLGAANAQEPPPRSEATLPQDSLSMDASTRPPEKPEGEEPAPPTDSDIEEVEPKGQMLGPPPPPKWYVQRETDQEYAACKLALSLLGTAYTEQPRQTDTANPECGIARPIQVQRILPELTLEGGALMRCDTARALGFWARDFLRPAAARLPGAPRVTSLQLGTTYDCRGRVGTGNTAPKLSEHALGNAIDIMSFTFDNGETLSVEPRTDTGEMAEAFQKAVRHAGCLYFTTVLGPGSNAAHDNHLHFDVAERNGGWRLCE